MSSTRRLTHQRRVQGLALLCGLPGLLVAAGLLIAGDYAPRVYFTVAILAGGTSLYFAIRLQQVILLPLQTASNMLSALLEGDFSLQAGYVHDDDPLGQLMLKINRLTEVLAEHRMEALALPWPSASACSPAASCSGSTSST